MQKAERTKNHPPQNPNQQKSKKKNCRGRKKPSIKEKIKGGKIVGEFHQRSDKEVIHRERARRFLRWCTAVQTYRKFKRKALKD